MVLFGSRRGFTLTEVLVVIAMMAVLTAIALPPFFTWRQNFLYKQGANEISNTLKWAKSRAINTNLQHRVGLVAASRSYQVARGDSAYRSSTWETAGLANGSLKQNVFLNLSGAATMNIEFNPNGTTDNNFSMNVGDNGSIRYNISVERSGRIRTFRK